MLRSHTMQLPPKRRRGVQSSATLPCSRTYTALPPQNPPPPFAIGSCFFNDGKCLSRSAGNTVEWRHAFTHKSLKIHTIHQGGLCPLRKKTRVRSKPESSMINSEILSRLGIDFKTVVIEFTT